VVNITHKQFSSVAVVWRSNLERLHPPTTSDSSTSKIAKLSGWIDHAAQKEGHTDEFTVYSSRSGHILSPKISDPTAECNHVLIVLNDVPPKKELDIPINSESDSPQVKNASFEGKNHETKLRLEEKSKIGPAIAILAAGITIFWGSVTAPFKKQKQSDPIARIIPVQTIPAPKKQEPLKEPDLSALQPPKLLIIPEKKNPVVEISRQEKITLLTQPDDAFLRQNAIFVSSEGIYMEAKGRLVKVAPLFSSERHDGHLLLVKLENSPLTPALILLHDSIPNAFEVQTYDHRTGAPVTYWFNTRQKFNSNFDSFKQVEDTLRAGIMRALEVPAGQVESK